MSKRDKEHPVTPSQTVSINNVNIDRYIDKDIDNFNAAAREAEEAQTALDIALEKRESLKKTLEINREKAAKKAKAFIERVTQNQANRNRILSSSEDSLVKKQMVIASQETSDHPAYSMSLEGSRFLIFWNTTELQREHFKFTKSSNSGLCENELFDKEAYLSRRGAQTERLLKTDAQYLVLTEADLSLVNMLTATGEFELINSMVLNPKLGVASKAYKDDPHVRSGIYILSRVNKGREPRAHDAFLRRQEAMQKLWSQFISQRWKDISGETELPSPGDQKDYQAFRMLMTLITLPNGQIAMLFAVHYKFGKPYEAEIAAAIEFARLYNFPAIIAGDHNHGIILDAEYQEIFAAPWGGPEKAALTALREDQLAQKIIEIPAQLSKSPSITPKGDKFSQEMPEPTKEEKKDEEKSEKEDILICPNVYIASGGGGTIMNRYSKEHGTFIPRDYMATRDLTIIDCCPGITVDIEPELSLKAGITESMRKEWLVHETTSTTPDNHYHYQRPLLRTVGSRPEDTQFLSWPWMKKEKKDISVSTSKDTTFAKLATSVTTPINDTMTSTSETVNGQASDENGEAKMVRLLK